MIFFTSAVQAFASAAQHAPPPSCAHDEDDWLFPQHAVIITAAQKRTITLVLILIGFMLKIMYLRGLL